MHQVLGVTFGLAVLVGNVIAVGIMRTPGEVATRLPSPGLFLAVWVAGGLYALLGAMSLAEGGIIARRSGGQYPIVRRALGPYPAFVVGWSDWISTAAALSLGAIVFAEFIAPLLPPVPGGPRVVASAVVLAFGWLNWSGVRSGDVAQQILAGAKALAFAALIIAAFVMTVPPGAPSAVPAADAVRAATPTGTALVAAIVIALQSVIYTYDGWTGPLYFGEETVDTGRTLPRAMIGGVLLVTLIYVLFNAAMLRVLGIDAMAGDAFVAGSASTRLFGANGDLAIRVLVLIAVLGGINSNVLFASRIPLAMSRDGLMPARFDRVNAGGTPTAAHVVSMAMALLFIVTGSFNAVLALAAFFFVATYAISFAAIFALRRKEPNTPRPFRAPGFPWTTGLVFVGSIAFLVGSVLSDRTNSMRSLLLLALSYPVYRFVQRASR